MGIVIGEILTILIVAGLLVTTVYFVYKKEHRKKIVLLIPMYLVIVLMIVSIIVENINYDNNYLHIYQIMDEEELDLALVKNEKRNYIYNLTTGEEVTYRELYNDKEFTVKKWHPIYLSEIDNYYIAIFSKDHTKEIEYNRFRITDYERTSADKIYLIEKETGYIFHIDEYDLIGKEIDLTSFQEGLNAIFFGVFLEHENNISAYYYVNIKPEYSLDSAMDVYENLNIEVMWGHEIGLVHVHVPGDPSEIIDFKVEGRYVYLKDSYDNALVGYYFQRNHDLDFDFYENLMEESLAKNGYVEVTEDGIYYVSNDHNLYQLIHFTRDILIEEDVPLDNWTDYIPNTN